MNPYLPQQSDPQAQAAEVSENESRYQALVENTRDWIWEMDLKGKHTYSNLRLEEILGYTLEEFQQLALEDLLHPQDAKTVSERLPTLIAERRGWQRWVVRFRHKDGSYRFLESSAAPILDADGAICGFRGMDRDITERRLADQALEEQTVFIDNALNSMGDIFFVVNEQNRLVRWNRRLAEVTGHSDAEIRAMAADAFFTSEDKEQRARAIEGMKRDGSLRVELNLLTKDGRAIPHEFTASLLTDAGGNVVGHCGIGRDITKATKARLELQQSEEKFGTVFRASPHPMILSDLPTRTRPARFVDVNQVFELVSGYKADEVVGRTAAEIDVWPLATDRENFVEELQKHGRVRDLEIRFRTKSKGILLCRCSAEVVQIAGEPLLLSSVNDITDQKRAEEALLDSEKRYRQLFERNLAGVFRATEDGRLLDCNDALAHILGAESAQELLSHRTQDFYLTSSARETFLRALRRTGELRSFEGTLQRLDGTMVHVLESVSLLSNGEGARHLEGTMIDVTERRKLEGQLLHANKMEAIGRLAGGVAHDFNNLLTAISGYAELGTSDPEAGDRLGGYFQEIGKAGESASTLTRQLLAFSRQQEFHPTVLDLNKVIGQFTELLKRSIGEEVELVTDLDQRLGQVKADSGQIEQVLMNLAINARDAMLQGGRLVVETSNVDLDASYASRHGVVTPGRYVMLAVTDDGHGMDTETSSRIFEPFFTTKQPEKGTGLGLATVYGIVKQNGGFIWVYSEPGEGTTFKIYLPRLDLDRHQDSTAIAQSSASGGSETILLVDDDESIRQLAETVLKKLGHTVLTASNSEGALRLVEKYSSSIDLLLTDNVMPGGNGQELAETVMEQLPEIKVVLMSGYGERARLDPRLAAKVDFLGKPFGSESLARTVRGALEP